MKKQISWGLGIAALVLIVGSIIIAVISDSAASASNTVASQIYLPLLIKPQGPIYFPYVNKAATPTPTPGSVPNPVLNSGFEQPYDNGPWFGSLNGSGFNARTDRTDLADVGVSPHNGDYAAWLGGTYSSQYDLQQEITIPAGGSTLRYWVWIQSDEPVCDINLDQAWVFFLTSTQNQVETYPLCISARTTGWVNRDVSLDSYAGQKGWLTFTVRINGANSNLFIDDVQLGTLSGSQFTPSGRLK